MKNEKLKIMVKLQTMSKSNLEVISDEIKKKIERDDS